jgi:hypothetical protein
MLPIRGLPDQPIRPEDTTSMRRAVALVGLFGIIGAGMSLAVVPSSRTAAASSEPRTFVIPPNDGYGVADCISDGGECGRIVADAWCEAQGFVKATAFGPAAREEVTGMIEKAAAGRVPADAGPPPLTITCGG